MTEHVIKAVGGVIAGAIVGWAGAALTLSPRVEAIEKGQARIEALVLKIVEAKGIGK